MLMLTFSNSSSSRSLVCFGASCFRPSLRAKLREVLQHDRPNLLAFLRMELRREDIVLPDRRHKWPPVIRRRRAHVPLDRFIEAGGAEYLDRITKCAHARHHQMIRTPHLLRRGDDLRRVAEALEGLLHAPQVGHSIIDNCQHGPLPQTNSRGASP